MTPRPNMVLPAMSSEYRTMRLLKEAGDTQTADLEKI